jgi:hypothetical protein
LVARFVPDETKDGLDAYNSAKFFGREQSLYSIDYQDGPVPA